MNGLETMPAANETVEQSWEELVQRAASGDDHALAAFYRASRWMVFALATSIVGDRSEAEEVVLDVYLQVWKQAARYDRRRGTAKAWLRTITRSRALDRVRRRANRGRYEVGVEDYPEPPALSRTPEAVMELGQSASWLRGALDHLREEQREAIELAFLSGLSHSELATELDLPLGTVKYRIRAGLSHLRELMKDVA